MRRTGPDAARDIAPRTSLTPLKVTMTNVPVTKTLEQTIAAIEALDLEPIKFKATRRDDGYGWSPAYAERMAQSYKRYLMLHAKYPEATLAPDQDTDRFWHLHILDTRKYAADCEAAFGEFLHHFPLQCSL
jgi:hypothetical protein